jgi:FkbM family methyltransferase
MEIKQPEGWYLPKADTYFSQFVPVRFMPGPPPKRNGFMREHLHEAFKFVKGWHVAIDVGAHVGFWTWDMAHRFERVYAFEPANDTYDCLVKNVGTLPNVTTANFAIGEANGRARMCDDEKRPGNTGSRFIMPGEEAGQESIPVVALDAMTFEACDLLKIDVEGFELQVLKGARELIERFRPVISMECDKKFERRYNVMLGSAEKLLMAAGYICVAHMPPDKVFQFN